MYLLIILLNVSHAKAEIITLQEFLKEVETQSPDLKAEKANVESAEARASGIRLSPPMVGYMQMKENGTSRSGYEVSQEIPFPTKIYQDKRVRNLEFEAQQKGSIYQSTSILAEAKVAYVSFWSLFERLKILQDKHHWLKHHVKLARAAVRSDNAAQIHFLELETEADLLENEILALEAEVIEKKNELKIYAPALSTSSLTPQEPDLESLPGHGEALLISWKEKEFESKEALESLKKQAYLPDVAVRLRSFNATDSMPPNQEIMVGVSIPFLFFWQPKAEVAEARAQKIKAQADLQKARIESSSKLTSFKIKAESIRKQLKNLKETIIPRAARRKKLVTTLSQRTMEGLDEHNKVAMSYFDLRIKALELHLAYENTVKEIVKLAGTEAKEGIR